MKTIAIRVSKADEIFLPQQIAIMKKLGNRESITMGDFAILIGLRNLAVQIQHKLEMAEEEGS